MKDPLLSQETGTRTTGFGRKDLKTDVGSPKPTTPPGKTGAAIKPQPPSEPVSERFPALEKQEVIFTLLAPGAAHVQLVGDFNGWRPDARPLKDTGAGKWVARVMLKSGQYEYRFVVDGRWIEDPEAGQRVANPYGGFNSVLLVPLQVQTDIL